MAQFPDVWKGPTPYGVLLPECYPGVGGGPGPIGGPWTPRPIPGGIAPPGVIPPPVGPGIRPAPSPPGPIPTPGGILPGGGPAPGTRVYAGHPAGPWGNPGYYDGPYQVGMENYWAARGGGVFFTGAEARAAMNLGG